MKHTTLQAPFGMCLALAALLFLGTSALAQEGSLLAPSGADPGVPLTLENASFLYQPLPPEAQRRELKIHDSVIVLVDYRASMNSEGNAESRKQANINAVLSDWIGFDGQDIFKAPQLRGDPRIAGSTNSQYRAESEIELRDALTFRIAAEIVDIQPNGNLVIEAHQEIKINEEVWVQSLSGVVARRFINPDNTVRSDAILHLSVDKREKGQVRDGYARGWLNRTFQRYKPF
jgi:flagellar L-ring protein precursor FlgH